MQYSQIRILGLASLKLLTYVIALIHHQISVKMLRSKNVKIMMLNYLNASLYIRWSACFKCYVFHAKRFRYL